jgi:starch synthase
LITASFSSSDLRNKAACKHELQRSFRMAAVPDAPLLALGSRITHQKMADVALAALPALLDSHPRLQVAVLGCGEHEYEKGFVELGRRYPGRMGVYIGYDERRAHALHAGADMLLHGTRFEPFGLTPIYSMRYGTIPIVSRVGGMIDTIADAGMKGKPAKGACGVLFDGEQPSDMIAAVKRTLELFDCHEEWLALQRNAMSGNFSWDAPARKYIDMYADIVPAAVKQLFAEAMPVEAEYPLTLNIAAA